MTRFDKIKQMDVKDFARFMLDGTNYLINDLCDEATEPEPGNCKYCKFYDRADCRYYIVEQWLESEE